MLLPKNEQLPAVFANPTSPDLRLITLSAEQIEQAYKWAEGLYPKRTNWMVPQASPSCSISSHDKGRYSHKCTYHRMEYSIDWQSVGLLEGKTLYALIGDDAYKINPPRGFEFVGQGSKFYAKRVRGKTLVEVMSGWFPLSPTELREKIVAAEEQRKGLNREVANRQARERKTAKDARATPYTATMFFGTKRSREWYRENGLAIRPYSVAYLQSRVESLHFRRGERDAFLSWLCMSLKQYTASARVGYSDLPWTHPSTEKRLARKSP